MPTLTVPKVTILPGGRFAPRGRAVVSGVYYDEPMSLPPRRIHARYACRLPVKVFTPGVREPRPGELRNISIGGGFLRVRGELTKKQITLEIPAGKDTVSFPARVVRTAGGDPERATWSRYGLAFQVPFTEEHKLRRIIDAVRRNQPGSKPLRRDYWKL